MAWGILEAKSTAANVPGTVLLEEESSNVTTTITHLKKVVHRGETIILVPQPSNDPNDPLNWPLWTRDLIFLIFAYCGILCIGGIGPILSALVVELSILFDVSLSQVALLTGYSLCATGAAGVFISASTHKYGKRITLLFSVMCAFVGTIWGGFALSYNSLLGARIIQGLSVSMFESVFFAVVGDLYFVHERGVRVAVVTTILAGVSNLPPVLAGKIASDLGWRWVFWLLAIFLAIGLLLSFFFGWETAYNRDPGFNTDLASEDNLETIDAKWAADAEHREHTESNTSQLETVSDISSPRKPFLARLNPYSTTYTDEPLWKLAVGPFTAVSNPVVIWAFLLMSFPSLWLVAINLLVGQIFASPPYYLDTVALGYLSAGPCVGGTLGSIVAGLISDPLIKLIARHNNGIYEPEFRLLLIIPAVMLSTIGYFTFGFLVEKGGSPVGMSALWGVSVASHQFFAMTVGTYCVDAYRNISVEIFIVTMVVKNFLFFGFSYFINDWIISWGPARMFSCVGGIQIGLSLTTIPLYIFGKRLRAWWHHTKVQQ